MIAINLIAPKIIVENYGNGVFYSCKRSKHAAYSKGIKKAT
jgi:hypothetical protein